MGLEQIIWIGKWIYSDGSSEGIQRELDKYQLIHNLDKNKVGREVPLIELPEDHYCHPSNDKPRPIRPEFPKIDSPSDIDNLGVYFEDHGMAFVPLDEYYDPFLDPGSDEARGVYAVDEYSVRRKCDHPGVERYELFFPFCAAEGKEDRRRAVVGSLVNMSRDSGMKHPLSNVYCSHSFFGKTLQDSLNKAAEDFLDPELILLQRDPDPQESGKVYSPHFLGISL